MLDMGMDFSKRAFRFFTYGWDGNEFAFVVGASEVMGLLFRNPYGGFQGAGVYFFYNVFKALHRALDFSF